MNKPLSIQPIPYQGSKRALAPRICSLFPDKIDTLYEPFAGSGAITLFAATHDLAEHFVIGDTYAPLIELWRMIIDTPTELSERYSELWHQQFDCGADHFNQVRTRFNANPDAVEFLYLVARCVKNAVRFNRHGHFTQSADKRRTGMRPDRLTRTAHAVSKLLRGRTTLFCGDFHECVKGAGRSDLIYMDPPYQGTSDGRDKRYAAQLDREHLIEALIRLSDRQIPYILSYDGRSGERTYGEPLPASIEAVRLEIEAGRSSQATLNGRNDATIESLYVSRKLDVEEGMVLQQRPMQEALFA